MTVIELEIFASTLSELESAVKRLAAKLQAPEQLLPTYGSPRGDGTPCLQKDGDGFHFVVSERGAEYERVTSRDVMEILYLVFNDITFSMASDFELAHRVEMQDFRRLIFQRQFELLARLSSRWAERVAREHERILQTHPFDDD